MRALTLLFLAILLTNLVAEDHLSVVVADPLVRPGVVWRCTVRSALDPGMVTGPVALTVSLMADSLVVAATEVLLPDALSLRSGVRVVLAPQGALPVGVVLEVRARLARDLPNGERPIVARTVRLLEDPSAVSRRGAAAVARLFAQRITDPVPRLLAEEMAELQFSTRPATLSDSQHLRSIVEQLEAWPQAVNGITSILAFRDPVDDSVQPFRLTVPPNVSGAPLVLLVHAGPRVTAKIDWARLPSAWLAAATAAGVAICEVYPAGDRALNGVTQRRVALAEAAARAVHPSLGAAITTVAHPGLHQPEAWHHAKPLPEVEPSVGRLAAWATGPFVIVVGSGENLAAAADARYLAQEFRTAWANHAQGLPPLILDKDYIPSNWPGYHLVLVGSARSNRVIGAMAQDLPLTWDDRVVTWREQEFHRSYLPFIAVAVAQKNNPQLTTLVLDGAPRWQGQSGEMPLAAEGHHADLVIVPAPEAPGTAVQVLLEACRK